MTVLDMWSAEDEKTGCKVICEYDTDRLMFVVCVSKNEILKKKEFPASFEPTFGIDVADLSKAQQIACELADSFDI